MSCSSQCNLAHWCPLSAASLIAAYGPSLLRKLRSIRGSYSILSYHLSLLLLHFFVLLWELSQIKFHDILNKTIQLILIMLQLSDVDDILFLQISEDYTMILIVAYILSNFLISHLKAQHWFQLI
jgi:hypothetical protein